MKRFLTIILLFMAFSCSNAVFAEELKISDLSVFSSKNNKYYGLKDKSGNIIVESKYKKLIRLGNNAWIVQKKNNKFGLMDCSGNFLVEPKFLKVERIYEKYAKFGNYSDFGIFDEYGNTILPNEFSVIEPMFGQRFLTCKKHKYGIYSITGEEILSNDYEFIYMPNPKTVRVKNNGIWYEFDRKELSSESMQAVDDYVFSEYSDDINIPQIFKNTGVGAGYGIVTATDYTLKIFSSVSVAYEDTIDELLFSKGVDTVPDLINFSWVIKFPFVFIQKYYATMFEPDAGPLSGIRNDLIEQIK